MTMKWGSSPHPMLTLSASGKTANVRRRSIMLNLPSPCGEGCLQRSEGRVGFLNGGTPPPPPHKGEGSKSQGRWFFHSLGSDIEQAHGSCILDFDDPDVGVDAASPFEVFVGFAFQYRLLGNQPRPAALAPVIVSRPRRRPKQDDATVEAINLNIDAARLLGAALNKHGCQPRGVAAAQVSV